MDPQRTTDLSLQFAAPLAPAWLLLILPLALAATWWLGRGRYPGLSRPLALTLFALRLTVIGSLVVLAWRPSVVLREVLSWPGRLAVLVDNSRSMAVADPQLDAVAALRLAHGLGMAATDAPAADASRALLPAEIALRTLARQRRDAVATEAWWDLIETTQGAVTAAVAAAEQAIAATAAWPDETRQRLATQQTEWAAIVRETEAALSGGEHAPAALGLLAERVATSAAHCLTTQARHDAARSADDPALNDVLNRMRTLSRADVIAAAQQHLTRWPQRPAGLAIDLRSLDAATGDTDLSGSIAALVREEHTNPLAAILLLSDGRESLFREDREAVAQAAVRRGVAVHAGLVGSHQEPPDLAVLALRAPPIAVQGRELRLSASIKRAMAGADAVTVQQEETVVARAALVESEQVVQDITFTLTPTDSGQQTYQVSLPNVIGEAVPTVNNTRSVVVDVRSEPLRVLLLDARPRWQTRFIAGVLGRLPYVELNLVVASANDDGMPQRGIAQGAWPADAAGLALYDLVIIGDEAASLLAEREWDEVRTLVVDGGRTLTLLGSQAATALPAAVRQALLPLTDGATGGDELASLGVTLAGQHDPLTRAWTTALPAVVADAARGHSEGLVLAALADGTPIISRRQSGKGTVVLLGSDRLWHRLNPNAHDAHVETIVALVALAAARREESLDGAPLLLERVVDTTGTAVLLADGAGIMVEAVQAGEVIATAQAEVVQADSQLALAHFPSLPAGALTLRRQGMDAGPLLTVLEHDAELGLLSRDDSLATALAAATGGYSGDLADVDRILPQLAPHERSERRERSWRLWDSGAILALLLVLLALEWTGRKFAGLV